MRGHASIVLAGVFGLSCTFGSGGGAVVVEGTETSEGDDDGADTTVAMTTVAMTTVEPDGDGDGTTEGSGESTGGGGSSDGLLPTTGAVDSSDSGDSTTGSTGGDVDAFGPFGPPVAIGALNDDFADDDDPTVRTDELQIYFNSDRSGTSRIWVSQRTNVSDEWDPPVVDESLSSFSGDTTPELSDDGLIMLLSSMRDGSAGHDPFISTRADFDSPWSTPARIDDLASPAFELGATIFDDVLYMCRTFNMDSELALLSFDIIDLDAGMFGPPQQVMAIDGDGDECTAHMSQNRLELFVERRGSGEAVGDPGFEIERATREAVGDDWSVPVLIEDLNSNVDDTDPFLGASGERLYFSSIRDGDDINLYVAERSRN